MAQGTCHKTQCSEFDPQDPHDEREEETPTVCFLTSTRSAVAHTKQLYKYIKTTKKHISIDPILYLQLYHIDFPNHPNLEWSSPSGDTVNEKDLCSKGFILKTLCYFILYGSLCTFPFPSSIFCSNRVWNISDLETLKGLMFLVDQDFLILNYIVLCFSRLWSLLTL